MRILVTGAAGFIGRSLVPRLAESHELIALVHEAQPLRFSGEVAVIVADLSRPLDQSRLPERIDIVVHLAQANLPLPEKATELFAVNTVSTAGLLDYARNAGAIRFILASSGSVYGARLGFASENDRVEPADFYAVSKYSSELLVRSYAAFFDCLALRLFQPYGPGQANRLIPGLGDRLRRGEPIKLNKDDRPFVTPLYIADVVTAFERAITSAIGGVLNIAGDASVSIRRLAEEISRVIKRNPLFEQTVGECGDSMGDNRLMKQVLGEWALVDLAEGLELTFVDREET